METPTVSDLGAQLDTDHLPETNGRMSVCRRCGMATDRPDGIHHVPRPSQLTRCSDWLLAENRRRDIDLARERRRGVM